MAPADKSGRTDDRQLALYLLALLPDEEAERLDDASIADDDVALRLRVVEDDLVDSYVSGTLDRELVGPFESHYLASPRRRQRVEFARSLLRVVDRAAAARTDDGGGSTPPAASTHVKAPARDSQPNGATPRSRLSAWLLVAAALLLVTSGTLMFQAVRLRNGLSVAHTESLALQRRARALEQQLADERQAKAAMTKELERVRESAGSGARRSTPESLTTALVLRPQTRAIAPVPTLAVPPGAGRLAFVLQMESNDFPRYLVALKDPASNQTVWRSDPITATVLGHAAAVSVAVPTGALKPQHYSLEITGGLAPGADVVASYTFEVVHR